MGLVKKFAPNYKAERDISACDGEITYDQNVQGECEWSIFISNVSD